jgi:hypothetical protein
MRWNIEEENLLFSHNIKKYVPDAEIRNEYWVIRQSLTPAKSYLVALKDFSIDFVDINCEGRTYRVPVIKDPKYQILSKEIENVWVKAINMNDTRKMLGLFYWKTIDRH